MKTKIRAISIIVIFVMLMASVPLQSPTAAQSSSFIVPRLTPAWTTGILSDWVGPNGIVVTDLNQDGKGDIATCSNGFAYVLNLETDGTYNTTWYSQDLQCASIAAGDRDGDDISELYIATEPGAVLLIDSLTYQDITSFGLPTGTEVRDIVVDDVDDDTGLEIVLATPGATFVYDATDFSLEWQANSFGGDQLAIGELDNDNVKEIVVNSLPGHVLNAASKTQEWAYSGGFGVSVGTGDVDADGRDEIGFVKDWGSAVVLEGESQLIKWQSPDLGDLEEIAVADVNSDGYAEVLVGNGQWGSITGYEGDDGAYLWSIPNPEHGVFGIGVGDANNDGTDEVVWGAGLSSSGKDALFVGSWVSQAVLWGTDDLDGPLYTAAGDIDLDGRGEFVLASFSSVSGYEGGTIRVYDGQTHMVEWSVDAAGSYFNIYQLAIGQLDQDPALEIIIGGDNWYDTRLQSYDGVSHSVEWTSPAIGSGGAPRAMFLKDIDDDGIDEVILGLGGKNVQVYNGASNVIQWDSGVLDADIQDVAAGDVDADNIQEIVVLTRASVYIVTSGTWDQKLHRGVTGGELVAVTEGGSQAEAGLALVVSADGTHHILQGWGGAGFPVTWQRALGEVTPKELASADVDEDGIRELVLLGSIGLYETHQSLLWIGSPTYPSFWEFKINDEWGSLNSMALDDVDNDGQLEFLFGSSTLIQVDDISPISLDIHQNLLPMVQKPCPSIFFDDFAVPAYSWPNKDAGNVLYAYNNGEYQIFLRPTGAGAGARPGIQASDYYMSVDLRNQNGTMGSYGLVFGLAQDWSSFYTMEVYNDGWYGIYRYDPSGYYSILAQAYSEYVHQGSASNKIVVERNGSNIKAYANGNLLATVSDSFYTGPRYFGLIVWTYDQPNLDVRFDNYKVNPLICGGPSSFTLGIEAGEASNGSQIFDYDLSAKLEHDVP